MKKIKNIGALLIFIVSLFGIGYASYNIIMWKVDTNTNNQIKKEVNKYVTKEDNTYKIDFKVLKERNSDVFGYLKVDGTNIDYIVLKTNNNDYYLNHNFDKNKNRAGWIFADYHNKLDGSDQNIIIYGHNMRDGSMFGTLPSVLKKNWNNKITFITEDNTYNYQVFSVYEIDDEDYYLKTSFNDDYDEFIKKLKLRSKYNYNVDITDTKQIITLSSCIGNNQKRIVLHAKLIEEVE